MVCKISMMVCSSRSDDSVVNDSKMLMHPALSNYFFLDEKVRFPERLSRAQIAMILKSRRECT